MEANPFRNAMKIASPAEKTALVARSGRTSGRVATFMSAAVLLCAIFVLAGWQFGIESFMTILAGSVRMKPNSAIAFAALASALLLESFRRLPRFRHLIASIALAIGGLTALEYAGGFYFGIDQLLFVDPVQKVFPGRMAPMTAINLTLIGLSIVLRAYPRLRLASSVLAFCVGVSALFAIVGYAYGVPLLYGSISYTAMAFHTGISFLLLSAASLSLDPTDSFGRVFRAAGSGGVVARRLVPIATATPLLLGFVFVSPRMNFEHLGFAVALTVVSCVIILAGVILRLARALETRDAEIDLARRDSLEDGMTGAFNRRHFDLQMEMEIARTERSGEPFSLILLDVDHFKSLNDAYGHLNGDAVLRHIARAGKATVRGSDYFCRYGGEEFAVIAPGIEGKAAMALAERLRLAMKSLVIDGIDRTITVSAGVTQVRASDRHAPDLVARADRALFAAKDAGRDCVRLAVEDQTFAPALPGKSSRIRAA